MKFLIPLIFITSILMLINSGCDTVEPVTGEVHGKLISSFSGTPLAFRNVHVGNKRFTTSQTGEFSVSDVTFPYDVALIDSVNFKAQIYKGLLTNNPVIVSEDYDFIQNTTYIINIPQSLINTGRYVAVFYSDGNTTNGYNVISPSDDDSTLRIDLTITQQQTGKLYLLSYKKDSTGQITAYDHFGMSPALSLMPGGYYYYTFTPSDISFNPEEVAVNGRFGYPTNYDFGNSYFYISFSDAKEINDPPNFQKISTNQFFVRVPGNLPVPVFFNVFKFCYNIEYSSEIFPIYKNVNNYLKVKKAVSVQSPPNGSKNISLNTPLTYQKGEGEGIYKIELNNQSLRGSYDIYTSNDFFSLKDIEPYFFTRVNNNSFYWRVRY